MYRVGKKKSTRVDCDSRARTFFFFFFSLFSIALLTGQLRRVPTGREMKCEPLFLNRATFSITVRASALCVMPVSRAGMVAGARCFVDAGYNAF